MNPDPVVRRVKLPLSLSQKLRREARQWGVSTSQIVARAIGRDLRSRAAIRVTNEAGPVLERKTSALVELLARRLRDCGFVCSARPDPAADYCFSVTLHDLHCELPREAQGDLSRLRVNATLCFAYRVVDSRSGVELVGRTLAISRSTPPIVAGTTVGGDVIDRLLDLAAQSVAEQFASLPLAR